MTHQNLHHGDFKPRKLITRLGLLPLFMQLRHYVGEQLPYSSLKSTAIVTIAIAGASGIDESFKGPSLGEQDWLVSHGLPWAFS